MIYMLLKDDGIIQWRRAENQDVREWLLPQVLNLMQIEAVFSA